MRDLNKDLEWIERDQGNKDLSDEYLKEHDCFSTRERYQNYAPDFQYGITFVESIIAKEWLDRAIKAENELSELIKTIDRIYEQINPIK